MITCKFCGRRGDRGWERYTDIPIMHRCKARTSCRARMERLNGSAAGRRQLVAGRIVIEADAFYEGLSGGMHERLKVKLSEGITINTYSDQYTGDVEWFLTFEDDPS